MGMKIQQHPDFPLTAQSVLSTKLQLHFSNRNFTSTIYKILRYRYRGMLKKILRPQLYPVCCKLYRHSNGISRSIFWYPLFSDWWVFLSFYGFLNPNYLCHA